MDHLVVVDNVQSWLTIVAVVSLSTWMGYQLVRALGLDIPKTQTLGLGVLLGGVLMSLLALVLVSLNVANELALAAVVVIAATTQSLSRVRMRTSLSPRTGSLDKRVMIQAVGLGLIGFSTFSLWSTALGVGILVSPWAGIIELKSQNHRKVYMAFGVLATAVISFRLYTYQSGWWYAESNDAPFFESLSWSLARFGENWHPGILNGSIDGYHYLGYLWAGTISDISSAPPFHVLNVFLPFLEVFSISLVLLPSPDGIKEAAKARALMVLALILGVRYTSFTSLTLANWSLICLVSLLFGIARHEPMSGFMRVSRLQLILGLFGIIAVLGKGTTLPIVLALGLATSSVNFLSDRKQHGWRSVRHIPFHLLIVCGIAWWWYFRAAQSAVLKLAEGSPLASILESGLNNGLWASRDVFQLLPTLMGLSAFTLLRSRREMNTSYRLDFLSIAVFGFLATSAIVIMPAVNARNYATGHALVVLLALGVVMVGRYKVPKAAIFLVPVVFVASAISWIEIYYLPDLVDRLWSSAPTRWIPLVITVARLPLSLLGSMVAIWVIVSLSSHDKQGEPNLGSLLPACIFTVLTLNVGVWHMVNRLDQFPELQSSTTLSEGDPFIKAHPDAATTSLGDWARKNLPVGATLASNSFCCVGITWLPEAANQIRSVNTNYQQIKNSESAYGGANYLLPAVTQRTYLLAGPRFIVGGASDAETIARYLEISVMFGATGDASFAVELRKAGVGYFVVDRLAIEPGQYPAFTQQALFENERFVVLDLSHA